jgi:hypothetical protein
MKPEPGSLRKARHIARNGLFLPVALALVLTSSVSHALGQGRETATPDSEPAQAIPCFPDPGHLFSGRDEPGQAAPGCDEQGQTIPALAEPGQTVPGRDEPGQTAPAWEDAVTVSTGEERGQTPPVSPGPAKPQTTAGTVQAQPLKIFLDCVDFGCDMDYLRTEIKFVDYMRDRSDAQVHVFITTESTGGGGREYTTRFIGLGSFTGNDAVLRHTTQQIASRDDVRRLLASTLRMGLMRYVAETTLRDAIRISYQPSTEQLQAAATATRDPWDFWVLRTRVGGFFSGERRNRSSNVNGSFSANRTTEDWKISASASLNHRESVYDLGAGNLYTNISRDFSTSGMMARSVGGHWAAGIRGSLGSSTFLNQDLAARVAPAIEYNVFPYSQSTRRQFTFQYGVGMNHFNYEAETIYNRMSESLGDQSLTMALDLKQPWGSMGTSVELSHYLQSWRNNRMVLSGDTDLRLFKGFSLNFAGTVSRIRDQVFLQKGSATPEEVLLRRRQLETSYRYFLSVGLGYTFGSIFNNVVNPRFRQRGGGMVMYF